RPSMVPAVTARTPPTIQPAGRPSIVAIRPPIAESDSVTSTGTTLANCDGIVIHSWYFGSLGPPPDGGRVHPRRLCLSDRQGPLCQPDPIACAHRNDRVVEIIGVGVQL